MQVVSPISGEMCDTKSRGSVSPNSIQFSPRRQDLRFLNLTASAIPYTTVEVYGDGVRFLRICSHHEISILGVLSRPPG